MTKNIEYPQTSDKGADVAAAVQIKQAQEAIANRDPNASKAVEIVIDTALKKQAAQG